MSPCLRYFLVERLLTSKRSRKTPSAGTFMLAPHAQANAKEAEDEVEHSESLEEPPTNMADSKPILLISWRSVPRAHHVLATRASPWLVSWLAAFYRDFSYQTY